MTTILLTCLHKITINRMVTFMTKAINDRIVSGTVKLSDNISKSVEIFRYTRWLPQPSGHEHIVCYPFIAGKKKKNNNNMRNDKYVTTAKILGMNCTTEECSETI